MLILIFLIIFKITSPTESQCRSFPLVTPPNEGTCNSDETMDCECTNDYGLGGCQQWDRCGTLCTFNCSCCKTVSCSRQCDESLCSQPDGCGGTCGAEADDPCGCRNTDDFAAEGVECASLISACPGGDDEDTESTLISQVCQYSCGLCEHEGSCGSYPDSFIEDGALGQYCRGATSSALAVSLDCTSYAIAIEKTSLPAAQSRSVVDCRNAHGSVDCYIFDENGGMCGDPHCRQPPDGYVLPIDGFYLGDEMEVTCAYWYYNTSSAPSCRCDPTSVDMICSGCERIITNSPTFQPTTSPSKNPSASIPTAAPVTQLPSSLPSTPPSSFPSSSPVVQPSNIPSASPSCLPSTTPSTLPTIGPSSDIPSKHPSELPSVGPTLYPSGNDPSLSPTFSQPSVLPSFTPTLFPSWTRPTRSPNTPNPTQFIAPGNTIINHYHTEEGGETVLLDEYSLLLLVIVGILCCCLCVACCLICRLYSLVREGRELLMMEDEKMYKAYISQSLSEQPPSPLYIDQVGNMDIESWKLDIPAQARVNKRPDAIAMIVSEDTIYGDFMTPDANEEQEGKESWGHAGGAEIEMSPLKKSDEMSPPTSMRDDPRDARRQAAVASPTRISVFKKDGRDRAISLLSIEEEERLFKEQFKVLLSLLDKTMEAIITLEELQMIYPMATEYDVDYMRKITTQDLDPDTFQTLFLDENDRFDIECLNEVISTVREIKNLREKKFRERLEDVMGLVDGALGGRVFLEELQAVAPQEEVDIFADWVAQPTLEELSKAFDNDRKPRNSESVEEFRDLLTTVKSRRDNLIDFDEEWKSLLRYIDNHIQGEVSADDLQRWYSDSPSAVLNLVARLDPDDTLKEMFAEEDGTFNVLQLQEVRKGLEECLIRKQMFAETNNSSEDDFDDSLRDLLSFIQSNKDTLTKEDIDETIVEHAKEPEIYLKLISHDIQEIDFAEAKTLFRRASGRLNSTVLSAMKESLDQRVNQKSARDEQFERNIQELHDLLDERTINSLDTKAFQNWDPDHRQKFQKIIESHRKMTVDELTDLFTDSDGTKDYEFNMDQIYMVIHLTRMVRSMRSTLEDEEDVGELSSDEFNRRMDSLDVDFDQSRRSVQSLRSFSDLSRYGNDSDQSGSPPRELPPTLIENPEPPTAANDGVQALTAQLQEDRSKQNKVLDKELASLITFACDKAKKWNIYEQALKQMYIDKGKLQDYSPHYIEILLGDKEEMLSRLESDPDTLRMLFANKSGIPRLRLIKDFHKILKEIVDMRKFNDEDDLRAMEREFEGKLRAFVSTLCADKDESSITIDSARKVYHKSAGHLLRLVDANGDGRISVDELKAFYTLPNGKFNFQGLQQLTSAFEQLHLREEAHNEEEKEENKDRDEEKARDSIVKLRQGGNLKVGERLRQYNTSVKKKFQTNSFRRQYNQAKKKFQSPSLSSVGDSGGEIRRVRKQSDVSVQSNDSEDVFGTVDPALLANEEKEEAPLTTPKHVREFFESQLDSVPETSEAEERTSVSDEEEPGMDTSGPQFSPSITTTDDFGNIQSLFDQHGRLMTSENDRSDSEEEEVRSPSNLQPDVRWQRHVKKIPSIDADSGIVLQKMLVYQGDGGDQPELPALTENNWDGSGSEEELDADITYRDKMEEIYPQKGTFKEMLKLYEKNAQPEVPKPPLSRRASRRRLKNELPVQIQQKRDPATSPDSSETPLPSRTQILKKKRGPSNAKRGTEDASIDFEPEKRDPATSPHLGGGHASEDDDSSTDSEEERMERQIVRSATLDEASLEKSFSGEIAIEEDSSSAHSTADVELPTENNPEESSELEGPVSMKYDESESLPPHFSNLTEFQAELKDHPHDPDFREAGILVSKVHDADFRADLPETSASHDLQEEAESGSVIVPNTSPEDVGPLDGIWTADGENTFSIQGNTITWFNGETSEIKWNDDFTEVQLSFNDEDYHGRSDGSEIVWDDEERWNKLVYI